MNRCGSTCLLTVTLVAINLFLGPAELATAQNGNYPSPNCPDDVASLGGIQDGSRPTMLSFNLVIEVEFLLDFGCHNSDLPTRIDEGVRLEFSLQSAVSSTNTGWIPIRYYAPSLEVPNDNTSLVELDSSNVSVTVQASMYSSTFPLILIEPSRSLALIREYICIPYVQNFTENLQLQLRWMQKFERPSNFFTSPWILDNINIRIWNGTCFLEVLSEDFFDDNFNFDSYELSFGFIQLMHCALSNARNSLLFENITTSPTMRFLTVNVTNIPVSFEDRAAPNVTTSNSLLESFDINSTLTLMCGFEGVPLPSLVWMHNGLPISSSNDSITITTTTTSCLSSGTSTLQWVNASTDTVGTFTCVATNNLGSANISFNVQIRTAPNVTTTNSLLESFDINSTLTLMCGFDGVPLPLLEWMHNGLPLSSLITISTTTSGLSSGTSMLQWVDASTDTVGTFTCVATNNLGTANRSFNVQIRTAPNVTTTNSHLESFDINSTLTLMCGFDGVPLPLLEWMHNGLPLSSLITISTTTSGLSSGTSTLQWVNASTDTVGTFTCVATNNLGTANRSFNVQIRTAPNVTTTNSHLESFDINSTLTLMCGFDGVPLPLLEWMHNGLPLSSLITISTTTSGLSSGTSTLQWVNASTDTVGTFTCVATNNLGTANRSFNVQIRTAPNVTTTNSLLESFDINSTLTLMCGFDGVPLPLLEWMHNGLPLSSLITISTTTSGLSSGTSTLQWVNASTDTVGTFTCVATNNLGTANRSFNVQIRTAPNVTTTNSLLESFDINSTLTLMCGFDGVPLPLLEWMHNGLPLSSLITISTTTSGLSSGTSTLQWVNASTDTVGTFTCVATNNLGTANRSFNVQIRTAPIVTTNSSLLESFDINSTLTLMCGFEGVPLPLLEWMHIGLRISSSNDSITITTTTSGLFSGTSTLQWVKASTDTVGTFTCVATNNLDTANRSFNAQIRTAPNVTTTNSLLESFDINSTLTLMCGFEGVPLPSLVWMHNGLPLSSSNDTITITTTTSGLSSGTSTLQWVNASTDTIGTFTCVATSNLGSANRSFNVQIRTAPNVTTTNSFLESFDLNSTLTLMCGFEGVPLPSLEWMHNGLCISNSNDSISITTSTSGLSSGTSKFQWVNTSMDTVGTFTCVATNSLDSANRFFNVQIRRFCTANQTEYLDVRYSWPETEVGVIASLPCYFYPDIATRECGPGRLWIEPNTSLCGSADSDLIHVLNDTVNLDRLEDKLNIVASSLQNRKVSETVMLLDMLSTYFTSVATLILNNGTTITLYLVVELVNIINSLQQWSAYLFLETDASYRIIMSFEALLVEYAQHLPVNQLIINTEADFVVKTINLPLERLKLMGWNISLNQEILNNGNDAIDGDLVASISLPSTLFAKISNRTRVGIFIALYIRPTLFPVRALENGTGGKTTIVGSPIIAAIVGSGPSFNDLQPPVQIYLSILTEINDSVIHEGSEVCVSWNFSAAENRGNWTPIGCTKVASIDGVVTCQCNHLTNFAVLIDICSRHQPDSCIKEASFDSALSLITFIGVSLSVVGLVITVITMLVFKMIRKRDATKFHIQLSLAIFFMLIVFVAGVNQTAVVGGCMAASVLIHYFTLASIMWMLAESLLLFQKLVFVFQKVTRKWLIIISLVCWLAPSVPVAIPLIIELANGMEASTDVIINREKFCFLNDPVAFWLAFLVPILVIILINFGIFIMVIVKTVRQTGARLSRIKKSVDIKTVLCLVFNMAGITFLFGISWIFAALTFTVKEIRTPGQVLFVVFNSLQGLFIFVFFCVLNKEARESWKEVLSFGRYISVYLNPALKWTSNKAAANIDHNHTSSSDCTSKNTSSQGILLSNRKRSSVVPLDSKHTAGTKNGSNNMCSEPEQPSKEEKKADLSSMNIEENHKSNIYSETEFKELNDSLVIEERGDYETNKLDVVPGIVEIHSNRAVLMDYEEEDEIRDVAIQ